MEKSNNKTKEVDVVEEETEETETCQECNSDMEFICADEGGCVTYWCPECGTIYQNMDGEEEWKTPLHNV